MNGMALSAIRQHLFRLIIAAEKQNGETEWELVARQLILALPPWILASTVEFEPAHDSDTLFRWRQTATRMAPHAKFSALYDRPFWRESGLSGTAQSGVAPLVEIRDVTLASGAAELFGFVGRSTQSSDQNGWKYAEVVMCGVDWSTIVITAACSLLVVS